VQKGTVGASRTRSKHALREVEEQDEEIPGDSVVHPPDLEQVDYGVELGVVIYWPTESLIDIRRDVGAVNSINSSVDQYRPDRDRRHRPRPATTSPATSSTRTVPTFPIE
jgi:hypothetical protein